MKNYPYGLLVVLFSGFLFGGCAKKEAVKAEEPLVPVVAAAPAAQPQPLPEPKPPTPTPPIPPSAPENVAVVPEQAVIPEQPQKPVAVEAAQKNVLEAIHFDFDKSDLREPDRDILSRNAEILIGKLKSNVKIEGHCDERGSAEYNLALGERRARSAMKYLVTLGVSPDRLSIISYGEEMPVDPGHNEDAWAKNRRAEFRIFGE